MYCIQMDSDRQPHAVNATLVLPEGGFTPTIATFVFVGEPVGCPAGTTWRILTARMIDGSPQPQQQRSSDD